VLRDLARLVRRRPAGVRLVLLSRMDPPISVPRLRLEGRLHEVRVDALRFTLDDAAALLSATGLQLPPAQVAVLHARTDGWGAGLRLAAVALRRTEDPDGFLTAFSGDERSVADYLTGEILADLSADTRDILRAVSVCSPLPAALAARLSGRPDVEVLLDQLGKETALMERTAPGTYRIHPLLRSCLSADLARQRPETYRELESTAARWWLAAEQPVHALRHAERAGDSALITSLVRDTGVTLLLGGDLASLRRALTTVGPNVRTTDPWLALTAAITHLEARDLPAAAAELANARRAWPVEPDAGLESLLAAAELLAASQGLKGNRSRTPPRTGRAPGGISPERTTPAPRTPAPRMPATRSRRWRHCCMPAAASPSSAAPVELTSTWPGRSSTKRWDSPVPAIWATWRFRPSGCSPHWLLSTAICAA
jgi:LuxR family maltose regulon positive regulatory protein